MEFESIISTSPVGGAGFFGFGYDRLLPGLLVPAILRFCKQPFIECIFPGNIIDLRGLFHPDLDAL